MYSENVFEIIYTFCQKKNTVFLVFNIFAKNVSCYFWDVLLLKKNSFIMQLSKKVFILQIDEGPFLVWKNRILLIEKWTLIGNIHENFGWGLKFRTVRF